MHSGYRPRFQSHAADGTVARLVAYHLRMHGAGVLHSFRLQRHAAFWTSARLALPHFRIHRTDVCDCALRHGWRGGSFWNAWRNWLSSRDAADCNKRRRLLGQIFLRIALKLLLASGAAEKVSLAVVVGGAPRLLRVNVHATHRIDDAAGTLLMQASHLIFFAVQVFPGISDEKLAATQTAEVICLPRV